jgi:hypothetical protein
MDGVNSNIKMGPYKLPAYIYPINSSGVGFTYIFLQLDISGAIPWPYLEM